MSLDHQQSDFEKRTLWIAKSIAFLLILYVFWKNAWASDDSFITMRVVDNFVNGYGLRWNVAERVQVFTHPLWLFVLSLFYLLINDPYLTVYIASLMISLLVIAGLYYFFVKDIQTLVFSTIVITSSHAFIDYSSSGLENPLTHLLLVLFAWVYLKGAEDHQYRFLILTFIAGLAAFNRLDSVLYFMPVLVHEMYRLRHRFGRVLWQGILGVIPIVGWEAFSILYYGFPFPNTYYAKLHTGIDALQLWKWGGWYILTGLVWDRLTYIFIIFVLILLFVYRQPKASLLFSGALIYIFYFIRAGGDFMSGRFFSGVFLVALIVLMELDITKRWGLKKTPNFLVALAFILLFSFSGGLSYHPLFLSDIDSEQFFAQGITDEKIFYFDTAWRKHQSTVIPYYLGQEGDEIKVSGEKYVQRSFIGFLGYHAGPGVYINDNLVLSDGLRARLPVTVIDRVGHYERPYPAGYTETILSDFEQNLIEHPDLALYFDKLSALIYTDDLFSQERLQIVWQMNTGQYDYLINSYLESSEWQSFKD